MMKMETFNFTLQKLRGMNGYLNLLPNGIIDGNFQEMEASMLNLESTVLTEEKMEGMK